MSIARRVARSLPAPVVNVAVHRDLYLPRPRSRRESGRLAVVYGNCQAEAVRRILLTHPGFTAGHRLLRVPAVHEMSAGELARLESRLPQVDLLIAQQVKDDYRGMPLGTGQLARRLAPGARVVTYPVAYFEGMFPFHVYVNRGDDPLSTSAPITDYHDLRILHAAVRGWDVATTLRRLARLHLDPQWLRRCAQLSLEQLAAREEHLDVRLSPTVATRPTEGFHTINHPTNALVTEIARQVLDRLGVQDPGAVLGSRQTYLDGLRAPRDPQIVRALGGTPDQRDRDVWVTASGSASTADVVRAHLAWYALDPGLVADGARKHARRLAALAAMWD